MNRRGRRGIKDSRGRGEVIDKGIVIKEIELIREKGEGRWEIKLEKIFK